MPELTEDGHITNRQRTLKVRMPKGIRQGQQMRLNHEQSSFHKTAYNG
jgi:curved DNA-binding protein